MDIYLNNSSSIQLTQTVSTIQLLKQYLVEEIVLSL